MGTEGDLAGLNLCAKSDSLFAFAVWRSGLRSRMPLRDPRGPAVTAFDGTSRRGRNFREAEP